MISPSLAFDAENNLMRLNGALVSLHCHYFNCGLLKALEEIPYIDGPEILREEAAKQFHANFKAMFREAKGEITSEILLKDSAEIYRFLGYGRIRLDQLDSRGGTATADSSYYVIGWLARYGRRSSPVCHLTRGFIQGVMAAIFQTEPEHYVVEETDCMILGSESCRFVVSERNNGR